jgi:hypothetical protein
MQRRRVFRAALLAIVFCCIAGCSDDRLALKVFPVNGKLMVGDKPAAGAHLAFHSVDRRIVSCPVAMTEPDGSFRLMTYTVDDCAGEDLIKHDRLFGVYFDSTKSPLRATVRPGPNDLTIEAVDPHALLKK